MKKSFILVAITIGLALVFGPASADERLAQKAVSDPVADIQNLYAFMNPPCRTMGGRGCEAEPEELIVAFTVHAFAADDARFSQNVSYRIHFENDAGVNRQIECSISADQVISCAGFNGLSAQAPVGSVGVNGDLRVFAGLRDDPFFLDLEAVQRGSFTDPGTDFFAGSNVLAIVLGIKNDSFPAGSGSRDANGARINVQKLWVSSVTQESVAISGAITGSWYNPQQSGQGWIIEVISTSSGQTQFLVYFFGHADNGEQLWTIGQSGDIENGSVTVDALRVTGMGFGGGFDPGSVMSEVVGTMTFQFSDCDNGTVTFASADGSLADFSSDIERLSNISGVQCAGAAKALVQLDREGWPLVNSLIPENRRDAYNAASNPAMWPGLFRSDLLEALEMLDGADGIVGNSFVDPEVMADILVDDRMLVDLEWSACPGFFGIVTSGLVPQPHTNDCGGRALDYSISDFLGLLINSFDPFITDNVDANDVPFLTVFPFLAPPH